MKGSLLSIFVFFAVLATVYGLKCYTCIGTDDSCSKGELEKDSSRETTCPSGWNICTRTWAKDDDGNTAVVQSCGTDATCKLLKDKCDEVAVGECAIGCCDTDLCNAGSSVSFSVFLMTICSILGLALLK
ncbi:hypothetical protein ACROYT_G041172 [Oculina patagonica]